MKVSLTLNGYFDHKIILGKTKCTFKYDYSLNGFDITKRVKGTIIGVNQIKNSKGNYKTSFLIQQPDSTLSNRYWKDTVILE